ncbi:hypothetical protein [Bremerella cremea]|uniref:hypothetical protein n=1 Tax=Bremerella cremea TaxID=1031537 RepID=UPI0013149AF5
MKYEEVYLKEYASGADCYQSLGEYLDYYDHRRRHQPLGQKNWQVYRPDQLK